MDLQVPMEFEQRERSPLVEEPGATVDKPTGLRKGRVVLGLVVLVGLLAVGVAPRLRRNAELAAASTEVKTRALPVNVVTVRRAPVTTELLLPGNIQAFQDTLIYARTTGYLRRWLVQIGDRVQAGQLLAEVESPEVDQELRQAQANLAQARANLLQVQATLELARVSALRWKNLVQQHAVSQQDADVQQSTFEARKADVQAAQATINSNQANVQRLLELQGFERVVAPFAGVITARNAEVGALITAGGSPTSKELFRIAQIDPLRIYVSVPQTFVTVLQVGQHAGIVVRELPQQSFTGTVTRTANALDPASRTLLTEVQLPNPEGRLLPGMYVQVQFALARPNPPLLVPANAFIVRTDGPQVALVSAEHTVHYQKIEVGRDYGNEVEVTAGLEDNAVVVANPTDDIREGVVVQPLTDQATQQAATHQSFAGRGSTL